MNKVILFTIIGTVVGAVLFFSFGAIFGGGSGSESVFVSWVWPALIAPTGYLGISTALLSGNAIGNIPFGLFITLLVLPVAYGVLGYLIGVIMRDKNMRIAGGTVGFYVAMIISSLVLNNYTVTTSISEHVLSVADVLWILLPFILAAVGWFVGKQMKPHQPVVM